MCLLNIWLSHTIVGWSIEGGKKSRSSLGLSSSLSLSLSLLSSHPPSYLSGHFGAYLFTGSSLIPSWQRFWRFFSNPSNTGQYVFRVSPLVMNDLWENTARDPSPPLLLVWWWRGGACRSGAARGPAKPRAGFTTVTERPNTNSWLPHNNSSVHTYVSCTRYREICVYSLMFE